MKHLKITHVNQQNKRGLKSILYLEFEWFSTRRIIRTKRIFRCKSNFFTNLDCIIKKTTELEAEKILIVHQVETLLVSFNNFCLFFVLIDFTIWWYSRLPI